LLLRRRMRREKLFILEFKLVILIDHEWIILILYFKKKEEEIMKGLN
jgi:hypothetical protein